MKKDRFHMRSALKDTAQRNKSLTGFVKCTLCVKFAFSEWNACGREGIYFISHRAERDISQCSTEHYFTFCKAKYFTICICDHKCSTCQEKRTESVKLSLSFSCQFEYTTLSQAHWGVPFVLCAYVDLYRAYRALLAFIKYVLTNCCFG